MTAREYFKSTKLYGRLNNWTLEAVLIFAEQYAEAKRKYDIEQVCNHPESVVRDTVHYRHCMKCGKKF